MPAREDLEADVALDLCKEFDKEGKRTIGVLTKVGHTVFTRILSFARSRAIPFVKPSIPNFVIQ